MEEAPLTSDPKARESVYRVTWFTTIVAVVLAVAVGVTERVHFGRHRMPSIRRSRTRASREGNAVGLTHEASSREPIRVLFGDGSLAGLRDILAVVDREGFDVVGNNRDRRELAALAFKLRPAVVVLDDAMPLESTLLVAREILRVDGRALLVLLARRAAEPEIVAAFRAGIKGYVLKADTRPELGRAIREVSRGGLFLSTGAGRGLTASYVDKAPMESHASQT